ncbi:MAG: sulfatase-like hydrolase/transferase [Acidobacteria bacterium]|nr:sulfatase-like hydrolase/transferase [Acidobacteriota bacterium]
MKTSRLPLAAIAALALAAAFSAACGGRADEPFNLLLITLDTTRADSIGAYGNREAATPNIDRLAQNGVMFRDCYAAVPLTLPSHCTLFTGRYPPAHGVRNNGTYFLPDTETTLAEVLKARGFRTSAFIASFTLLSKFGLGQGFEVYDETFRQSQAALNFHDEIPANEITRKFSSWLEKTHGERFFSWLHFFDPHHPYLRHAEVDARFSGSERRAYEGEIAYVDLHIGEIIRLLEAKKLLERTIIVVVGDHGEAFGEHQEFGHGVFCYEESLKVPLVLYNPVLFTRGRQVAGRVSLADVLPSLLHYLAIAVPEKVQGVSFHGLAAGRGERQPRDIYFESRFGMEANNWAPITGMIAGNHKYISLIEPELYDLGSDPAERVNRHRQKNILARGLDSKLRRFLLDHSSSAGAGRRELSAADVDSLKTLGYISASSAKAKDMIDPKQGYGLYAQVELLKEKARAGEHARVQAELERLVAANPGVQLPGFFELEFSIKKNTGRAAEALAVLEKASAAFPDHELFKLILATELSSRGLVARAQELCRELLDRNPRFAAALILLGDMAREQGRRAEAAGHYRRALAIEPQNTRLPELLAQMESQAVPTASERVAGLEKRAAALVADNRLDEARNLLRQILDLDPGHVSARVDLGAIATRRGALNEALAYFQEAARLDPGHALAHCNLGVVLFNLFRQERDRARLQPALESFDRAVRLDPRLSEAYNGRGAVHMELGANERAAADFYKVIELRPGTVNAYFNLAYALVNSGRRSEALAVLSRFKESYEAKLQPRQRQELDALIAEIGS